MSKHLSILAFVFSFVLSVWLPHFAVAAPSGFTCVLSSDRTTYEVGQQPVFTVRITNQISKEIMLVGCLDGSTEGRRFPECRIEVIDAAGKPVRLSLGYCGNMNSLSSSDFVSIAPGGSFDPVGKKFFHPVQFDRFPVQQPGVYTVRFTYSTSSTNVSDYMGDEIRSHLVIVQPFIGGTKQKTINEMTSRYEGDKDRMDVQGAGPVIQPLFDRVVHIALKSNDLKLTFTPKSK